MGERHGGILGRALDWVSASPLISDETLEKSFLQATIFLHDQINEKIQCLVGSQAFYVEQVWKYFKNYKTL